MALHVNANLALVTVTDDARRPDAFSKIAPRAQLAAQLSQNLTAEQVTRAETEAAAFRPE